MLVIIMTIVIGLFMFRLSDITDMGDSVINGFMCILVLLSGAAAVTLIGSSTDKFSTTFETYETYQIICDTEKQDIEIETSETNNATYYLVNVNDNGTKQTVKLIENRTQFEQCDDTQVPYIEIGNKRLKNVWLYSPPLPVANHYIVHYPSWYDVENLNNCN